MNTTLKDMQGKTVNVGDRVAYASYWNVGLTIGIVESLGTVRAKIVHESNTAWSNKPESFATNLVLKLGKK